MTTRDKVARELLRISDEYVEWDGRPEEEKQRWLSDADRIDALYAEDRRALVKALRLARKTLAFEGYNVSGPTISTIDVALKAAEEV